MILMLRERDQIMPKRFRLIPVDVEAIKIADDDSIERALLWTGGVESISESVLIIPTAKGILRVAHGDYIVKDHDGEFSVVSAKDFEKKYERL